MQKNTAIHRPFETTNEPLAIGLATMAVPWPKDDNGNPAPCFNVYSFDVLRGIETARANAGKSPLGLAGKSLDDAIRIAYRAREKGTVSYRFEKTPTLHAFLEGWSEQSDIIEALDRGESPRAKSGELLIAPEIASRLLCQYSKMKSDFAGNRRTPPLWMSSLPLAQTVNATTRGNALSEQGSVTEGSLNLRSVKV